MWGIRLMTFTENDKMKALAIVHIFETSRPFGDYAACVVLDDGAGVSYGINQFTHRSGSLAAVVERYLELRGQNGREILASRLPILRKTSAAAVAKLAADELFKATLRRAAATSEMRSAQNEIATEKYLQPAIRICEKMGFSLPLSLAVIYDSVTHGSWEYISARVHQAAKMETPDDRRFEKSWITEYVCVRHRWLTDIKRLRSTNYRTKFFLDQIAISNWRLGLPIAVHGVRLTPEMFVPRPLENTRRGTEKADSIEPPPALQAAEIPSDAVTPTVTPTVTVLQSAGEIAASAATKFDRVDSVINTAISRKDAAKSLWTTIYGSIGQAAWAVFGFVIGLPREVWIVVAIIAAALMFAYLYRQIMLGRIRELDAAAQK